MTRLLGLLLIIFSTASQGADYTYLREMVHPVVFPNTAGGLSAGSMVVITPNYALTANHVIRAMTRGVSEARALVRGKAISITVVKRDKNYDVALLAGNFGCPCAPIGRLPEVDDPVIGISFPEYIGFAAQFATPGQVQQRNALQILSTVLAAPGSSGGGLFSFQEGEYKLVGIIRAVGHTEAPNRPVQILSWMTFAVPVQHGVALLP